MTELEQENLRLKDLLDQTPQLIHDYFDCRDISRFIDNLSRYQLLATDSDDEKEEPQKKNEENKENKENEQKNEINQQKPTYQQMKDMQPRQ